MTEETRIRLNKLIARHTGVSRREADEMIEKGSVSVNGAVATLGAQVVASDTITVDGKQIDVTTGAILLLLNKPRGYVSSRKQQGESPTLYDLLPSSYHSLKTVGRLDRDSSGLILLTNDGDLSHQMTHPSFHKMKIYEASLDKPLAPLHRQMIADFGVMLEDGKSQFGLDRLVEGDETQWRVSMIEGRNRQIRRTFAALGYTVVTLHRTSFGKYNLGDISEGNFEAVDIS